MHQDQRETAESEQWVIDQLVEAVEAGDAMNKLKYGARLLEGYSKHDWKRRVMVASGIVLLHDALDPNAVDLDDVVEILAQADVSDTRLTEISEGAPLTESEVHEWQRTVTERAFDPGLVYECGAGNMCVVLAVKHSNGRRAYFAAQHWDGSSGVLVAAYSTYDEALNALRSIGIVRIDDQLMMEDRYRREDGFNV